MSKQVLSESKEWAKAEKLMGPKAVMEFAAKSEEELKELIAVNSSAIQAAKDETKENPAYLAAKLTIKDFNDALKERNNPLQIAINLATKTINARKDGTAE